MENSQGKFNMVRIGVLQSCFQAEGIQISQSLFMLLRIFIFRFSPFETSSAFFFAFFATFTSFCTTSQTDFHLIHVNSIIVK